MKLRGEKEVLKRVCFLLIVITLFVLIASTTLAEVVVFDRYDTKTTLEKGSLHVERDLRIKNVGRNPIIPGELHFKLYELKKGEKVAPDITGFLASNPYDSTLDVRKIVSNDEVDLVINIWDPLLPDFFYEFKMSYDIKFKPSGLLFYELQIPKEDTTIPIKSSKTDFYVPKSYYVTYAPDAQVEKENKFRVVSWQDEDDMSLEYTRIPFPKIGIRAVNIFWIFMIVIFLVVFVWRMAKNRS